MKNILLPIVAFAVALGAQAQIVATNIPRTEFESFRLTAGAPLLRGMSAVQGDPSLFMEVRAEKLTNLNTSNTVRAVSLRGRAANYTDIDYIDDDEVDGLIRAIGAISQASHAVTTMDDFELIYHTRSGFTISKESAGNTVAIIVRSGRDDRQRVQIESYTLDDLGRAIIAAKGKLGSH